MAKPKDLKDLNKRKKIFADEASTIEKATERARGVQSGLSRVDASAEAPRHGEEIDNRRSPAAPVGHC